MCLCHIRTDLLELNKNCVVCVWFTWLCLTLTRKTLQKQTFEKPCYRVEIFMPFLSPIIYLVIHRSLSFFSASSRLEHPPPFFFFIYTNGCLSYILFLPPSDAPTTPFHLIPNFSPNLLASTPPTPLLPFLLQPPPPPFPFFSYSSAT